jgi:chromosome segregation ATPase
VLAELDALAEEVERIREEAAAAGERLERLPGERAAARAEREEAEALAAERRETHEAAAAALAKAEAGRDDARIAEARREELRARDLLRSAERRAERARADEERLEGEEAALAQTVQEFAERARRLADELARRPGLSETAAPPAEAGPAELAAWATETRAALFVARGRLASEREAVIRQANELGALVLGEPLTAQSAARVARRVEELRQR